MVAANLNGKGRRLTRRPSQPPPLARRYWREVIHFLLETLQVTTSFSASTVVGHGFSVKERRPAVDVQHNRCFEVSTERWKLVLQLRFR